MSIPSILKGLTTSGITYLAYLRKEMRKDLEGKKLSDEKSDEKRYKFLLYALTCTQTRTRALKECLVGIGHGELMFLSVDGSLHSAERIVPYGSAEYIGALYARGRNRVSLDIVLCKLFIGENELHADEHEDDEYLGNEPAIFDDGDEPIGDEHDEVDFELFDEEDFPHRARQNEKVLTQDRIKISPIVLREYSIKNRILSFCQKPEITEEIDKKLFYMMLDLHFEAYSTISYEFEW